MMDKFYLNGKDLTRDSVVQFNLFIEKDGTYDLSIEDHSFLPYTEEGSWFLSNDKKVLTLHHKESVPDNMGTFVGPQEEGERTWTVTKFEVDELWLSQRQPVSGDTWDVQLKPYSCCH